MKTLHLVSHTHWDREWYLTFQQFRLKLVHLIDSLLDIFLIDPHYRYFMLDGQTIVLDDYLQIRSERESELRTLIQSGRLLIGPWHVLPDEFLVSPESTIRNLLLGERTARRFGNKMMVGYIPDPFGHIGQMPQILSGFGIHTACIQRGLDNQPCEFWWQSPDGSKVLMAYMRDGYGNAAALPTTDPSKFLFEVGKLRDSLEPYTAFDHILLMHGTDHMEAQPKTSAAIAYANKYLIGETIVHSTLPDYLSALQTSILNSASSIPIVSGELRSGKRHHLLPGVLSTRPWIKQRNTACEVLLEKWVEPFYSFASNISLMRINNQKSTIHHAWRLLMECHPHDSICGCSIDQVHEEMRSRFDQVEQIGEEITGQSLKILSDAVNTARGLAKINTSTGILEIAIVVFNPTALTSDGLVELSLQLFENTQAFEFFDDTGKSLPHQVIETTRRPLIHQTYDRAGILTILSGVTDGKVIGLATPGMSLQGLSLERIPNALVINAVLSDFGEPNEAVIADATPQMIAALADPALDTFVLRAEILSSTIRFRATEVPSYGYRTFYLRQVSHFVPPVETREEEPSNKAYTISNEFLSVTASPIDGSLSLKDLRSGMVYTGQNHFLDGGDCGDEYNYCPPVLDRIVSTHLLQINLKINPLEQALQVELEMAAPIGLANNRSCRLDDTLPVRITSNARLVPGVPRLEIHTEIENQVSDHRLRVHFPSPFTVREAQYDGHFEVVNRLLQLPPFDSSWVEQPRPEAPQRTFVAIDDGGQGLLIANRGIHEVEVFLNGDGKTEIALTLLRCIGWLSRDDLSTRQGHAGPGLPTPGAQMIGRWSFDYAIISFLNHQDEIFQAYQQAYAFNSPMRAVPTTLHDGLLPHSGSFLEVLPAEFVISAIKSAEFGNGLIIRGYNLAGNPIQVSIKLWKRFESIYRVNLAEEIMEELVCDIDGKISLVAKGHEIVTIKLV